MVYLTLTRKRLFIILLSIITVSFIAFEIYGAAKQTQNAKTNQDRVDFASGIGYTVDESCLAVKDTKIPQSDDETLLKLNLSQIKKGYNLLQFCGSEAKIYSYKILLPQEESGKILNIFTYKNRVIGWETS